MIHRIDDKTVRIKIGDSYYFLDIPEGNNLIVVERIFTRGFEEGKKLKEVV